MKFGLTDEQLRRVAASVIPKKALHKSAGASDSAFRQYVETALWSSTDESDESGGDPMDKNYSIDDFDPESLEKMRADVNKFFAENEALIDQADSEYGMDSEGVAHDFWLTRNRHGAGFWDGDYGDIGDALTEASRKFGECNLIIGDDGLVHLY